MSNGAPTIFLLWSILSTTFQVFLAQHLWAYDKFNCLRWNSGRQPGAFKRVMTFSYLLTLPLLTTFGVALAALKYKEGYILSPRGDVEPRPYSMWSSDTKRWIVPLNFVLAVAWASELVTHLEELNFWIFLIHQGPSRRSWFRSWEFLTWVVGSICALITLPLTAGLTRHDLDQSQGWIFLIGSAAGTTTTILFLYVIVRFPGFVTLVRVGGAPPDVVARLQTFHRLNLYRVVFRFLFTVPLFIVAFDSVGKRTDKHRTFVNIFWSDFLFTIGLLGCFASSAITLLIFFPLPPKNTCPHPHPPPSPFQSPKSAESLVHDAPNSHAGENSEDTVWDRGSIRSAEHGEFEMTDGLVYTDGYQSSSEGSLEHCGTQEGVEHDLSRRGSRRSRRRPQSLPIALERGRAQLALSLRWAEAGGTTTCLHPYVMNFTSPIDLLDSDSRSERHNPT